MTIDEASIRYSIPLDILHKSKSRGLCGAVKKVMGASKQKTICGCYRKEKVPRRKGLICDRLWEYRKRCEGIHCSGAEYTGSAGNRKSWLLWKLQMELNISRRRYNAIYKTWKF